MAAEKNSNPRRKARMKECWTRGKANATKRNEQNKAREAENKAAGYEPTFRYVLNEDGKVLRSRRDTHAWSVARAKRKAFRATVKAERDRAKALAEADNLVMERALASLAAQL